MAPTLRTRRKLTAVVDFATVCCLATLALRGTLGQFFRHAHKLHPSAPMGK